MQKVTAGRAVLGDGRLFLIAGPCVIESEEMCLEIAKEAGRVAMSLGIPYVFKASFDKANRTSVSGFRGPGLGKGLEILAKVKKSAGVPILTDIHEPSQAEPVAAVADIIQIPAFLCRQTDLLLAAGRTGRAVNVKKAQFIAPWDMKPVVEKLLSTGNRNLLLTERGTAFGYNRLVVDMRAIAAMKALGFPVVIDATHAVQEPGSLGAATGGDRSAVPVIARAAVAAGADGVFLEIHPEPDNAKSDAANSLALAALAPLMETLVAIKEACDRPKLAR